MTRDEIIQSLSHALKPSRFRHTMGVCSAAVKLSVLHGIDAEKAYLAALLHDCAKSMTTEDMLKIISEENIQIDDYERGTEAILHAPAGCALAKRKYGISDPEILDAIRYHTIGCDKPSPLMKLIYICDFIEEGRKPFDGLEEARSLSLKSLDAALLMCARLSNEYVLSRGGKAHAATLKMINNTEVHI